MKVTQELDSRTFAVQKLKHEQRQAEGGAIGIVWLGSAVVLVRRARTVLHPGWALPGGTVEKGQRFDEAFIREVQEETGIVSSLDDTRLLVAEEKTFCSPSGEKFLMHVAVFETTAHPNQRVAKTLEAQEEGLEVRLFSIDTLPKEMILRDREKLDLAIAAKCRALRTLGCP